MINVFNAPIEASTLDEFADKKEDGNREIFDKVRSKIHFLLKTQCPSTSFRLLEI
ncbi:unnamed protein product [Nippostrongylus brasiliensis]|uniref:Uncharacterized protein n=1 Tax=Nippostrongylus brasiliensis TaxID=27835 RepID=A0A0N4YVQ8_NIPBR|nr:unnamed protein product [Nippostrongylus brasiliensis]